MSSLANSRLRQALPAPLLALAFVLLTWTSWRRWPDLMIDFGRELYLPWRLANGAVLYRDVEHVYGPLSPYLNAMIFKLGGDGYTSLIVANLALAAAATVLVFLLLRQAFGRWAATCGTLIFLTVFAFNHNGPIGGYNFIGPYAHEAVHGSLLLLLLLYAHLQHHHGPHRGWLLLAGGCLGCLFLTKPEYFVAGLATSAMWSLLEFVHRPPRPPRPAAWGWLAGSAAIPPLVTAGAFRAVVPVRESLLATAGAWRAFWEKPGLVTNPFYAWSAGTDRLAANVQAMLLGTLLVIVVVVGLGYLAIRWRQGGPLNTFVVGVATALLLLVTWQQEPLREVRAVPLLVLLAALGCLPWQLPLRLGCGRRLALLWGAMSFTLLFKIFFFCRFWQYGAFLAMPAALFLTAFALGCLPARVRALGGSARFFRAAVTALLATGLWPYLSDSLYCYQQRGYAVGVGADRILSYAPEADLRAPAVNQFLDWAKPRFTAKTTLVVLPEGPMLNYLARAPSTVKYYNYLPPELLGTGEGVVLAALQRQPPQFVALVTRNTDNFGKGAFGDDPTYGRQIMVWVSTHYQEVPAFACPPAKAGGYRIRVWQRQEEHREAL